MTAIQSIAAVQVLSVAVLLIGELTGAPAVSALGATAFAAALLAAFAVMTFDLARGTVDWARLVDHSTDGTVPRPR